MLDRKQESEIFDRYVNGEPSTKIAIRFGVSYPTILKIVRKKEGKVRTSGEYKRRFNSKKEKEIFKKYIDGLSSLYLAKKYACCINTILEIIKRNNGYIRTNSESHQKLSKKEEKKIMIGYSKGLTCSKLAKKYCIGYSTIWRAINRNGRTRTSREAMGKLTEIDVKAIVKAYLGGESSPKLCKKFNLNDPNSILYIVRSKGIKIRTGSEANKLTWKDPEFIKKIKKSYTFERREQARQLCIKQLKEGYKPSKFEKRIMKLIKQNHLPWKYIGDGREGSFFGKVPDFINTNGQKAFVEAYEDNYWHDKTYVPKRRRHFAKFGFKTIFIHYKDKDEIIIEKLNTEQEDKKAGEENAI